MIFQASLTGLFRLIMYFLLFYVVFTAIARYIFPLLLRAYINNFRKRFESDNSDLFDNEKKKEGEIKISNIHNNKASKKASSNDDYVDYEEIK
jgi:predicted Holliday junction resolvase-like endonuclease